MNSVAKQEKNFISVVVYTKNHEAHIQAFIENITKVLDINFEKYEVIFVNDLGVDNTVRIIRDTFRKYTDKACTIINLSYEHGIEGAMVAGQDVAIGDFVYEFDTPVMDYGIDKIMEIYRKCLQGYDIVSASPDVEKMSSTLFYKLFKVNSKNKVALQSERFRILSRRGINRIKNISETIPYRKAIYFNCGLKTATVVFESEKRASKGIKDNSFFEKVNFATDSLLFFTNIGWKISASLTTMMVLFSIGIGMYSLITWIVNENVISGWTTIMMVLSIAFSALFVLITILIKYVALILLVNTNKQDYVFESIEKIK